MHNAYYGKQYTFHSFSALNSTQIISEVPKFDREPSLASCPALFQSRQEATVLLMLGNVGEVCSVHVSMSISHAQWQTVHIL